MSPLAAEYLTAADLRAALAAVTYRDGWSFTLAESRHEGPLLRITVAGEPDSRHPGATVDLGIDTYVPPFRDVPAFLDWLLWRLQRVASHEVREFLCYRGALISDPHA